MIPHGGKRTNLVVMAAVILPRLLWCFYLGGRLPDPGRDQPLYLHLASRIADGEGLSFGSDLALLKSMMGEESSLSDAWQGDPEYVFGLARADAPTASIEPGYPVILALGYLLLGRTTGTVFALNMAASILGALSLVHLIRRRWGERSALAAGLRWAIYPFFVYYSAYAMSEAIHISMLPVCLVLVDRATGRGGGALFWAGAAGIACGLLFLVRSSTFVMVPILLAYLGFRSRKGARLARTGMLLLGALVAVSPWIIRNWSEMGQPLLFPTKGALNLWMRNHPDVLEIEGYVIPENLRGWIDRTDLLEYPQFSEQDDEVTRSSILQRRAVSFVLTNPELTARLCARRFVAFLTPIGAAGGRLATLVGIVLYLPLLGLAVWQTVRGVRDPLVLALAAIFLAYLALHTLAHGGVRYRVPVEGCLIALASRSLLSGAGDGKNV